MSDLKLYVDWGRPNGDETTMSFLDRKGLTHIVTGYPARVLAEYQQENEALRKENDSLVEALKAIRLEARRGALVVDEGQEVLLRNISKIAIAALKAARG